MEDQSVKSQCFDCEKTDADVELSRCPSCYRYFCDTHSHMQSGRRFCSRPCASFYLYSDEDDT